MVSYHSLGESYSNFVLEAEGIKAGFGLNEVVHSISIKIPKGTAMAFMGPSGCGKSTFLRCLNRMHEETDTSADKKPFVKGSVIYTHSGSCEDIYASHIDMPEIRKKISYVAQIPRTFPHLNILDNVAYHPRLLLGLSKKESIERALEAFEAAGLYKDLKDRLHEYTKLSGGEEQRLCIARSLAMHPDVILMDEPCSQLDPPGAAKVEETIARISKKASTTIVIVTHNFGQANRLAQYTGYFHLGELLEFGPTDRIFNNSQHEKTLEFITTRAK